LVDLIAEQISDGRVLRLIKTILQSGVMTDDGWQATETGVPQGGVASPLWSNIYLTPFDCEMTEKGYRMVRWADDFVVLCKTRKEAQQALAIAERFLREMLGVQLHPEKTRVVHVQNGFEFLGYKVKQGKGFALVRSRRRTGSNRMNLYAIPRAKSVARFKERIRALTRRNTPISLPELLHRINPVIRGWGQYFRKAHVRVLFNRLDRWIEHRIHSFLAKKWRNGMWARYSSKVLIRDYGLVRLTHLVPGLTTR
jgi:group II intron reverse transcriptase/maturase